MKTFNCLAPYLSLIHISMDRTRLIEEAIHSGEMEGAYVSAEFREDADEYVKGEITIEDLMRRTKRRWNINYEESTYVG